MSKTLKNQDKHLWRIRQSDPPEMLDQTIYRTEHLSYWSIHLARIKVTNSVIKNELVLDLEQRKATH